MPPRRRAPSEDLSDSYDGQSDEEAEADELSGDEIPGEISSANCRVMSTRELFQQMTNHTIDVEPPYQRDVVWAKAAQSSLIDSIFKNKWVPTLLFSERIVSTETSSSKQDGPSRSQTTKKKRIWVCMDGKQRLTSIKFITGKIPWTRQPGKHWYFKQSNPPSPSRLIISEELQELFLQRGITTALYIGLSEMEERDIFRLVQEGKPLTIGEKMQAAAGPWGEYFDELTQAYMVRDAKHPNGWCGRITKLSRGADFKTITAMVLLIRDKETRPDPPRLLTSQQLQKELSALVAVQVPDKLKREVKLLLDMFMSISLLAPPNTQYTTELNTPEAIFAPIKQGRKSMISPVEMIWIPYMIGYHGRQLSIGRLLELIELFKVDIRNRFPKEVKNNTEVTRFITDWVATVDLRRLKGKYSGFRVPRLPEPAKTDTSGSSCVTSQTQPGPNQRPNELQDSKVTIATLLSHSSTQQKRKIGLDSESPSTASVTKRARALVASLQQSSASQPTPQLDPTPSSSTTPLSQSTFASTATGGRTGSSGIMRTNNHANGVERAHADVVGSLFGKNLPSRIEQNRVGQSQAFNTTARNGQAQQAQQALQTSNFAPRGTNLMLAGISHTQRPTQVNRNPDNREVARPRPSFASNPLL